MNKSTAQAILQRFAGLRILVVGDVMLDEYIWGHVNRISPEAPVIVVDADRYTQVPGGAANVVNNLCIMGATGMIAGIVGVDTAGQTLADALQAEGADTRGLVQATDRPTTRKTRIIAHSQQVVRVDHERRGEASQETTANIAETVKTLGAEADAILLSDYQKGVVSSDVIYACAEIGRTRGIPVTGNLKPAALTASAPIGVITLNLHEASVAMGGRPLMGNDDIEQAAHSLLERTGAKSVLITRGGDGLSLLTRGEPIQNVPARRVEVYDTAGAGDTVISTLTLALAAGASLTESVDLANHAAAEAVKKLGVSTVSPDEILAGYPEA